MDARISKHVVIMLILAVTITVNGCSDSTTNQPTAQTPAPPSLPAADAGHNLEGWWCAEHGIPEEECTMCSSDAAAKCKEKGDWCKEHGRADSQCFICHPELEAKFAERYEAKVGKKPPKPTG